MDRQNVCGRGVLALGLILAAGGVCAADEVARPTEPNLLVAYPDVRTAPLYGTGRPQVFYGASMTQGTSPQDAAARFLANHSGAWGAGAISLVQDMTYDVSFGKFTAFQYHQVIDGLPVEYSMVTVLVSNGTNRVVYAAGTLAQTPRGGLPQSAIDPAQALNAVRLMPAYKHLTKWSAPTQSVYFGSGPYGDARRVVKLQGSNPDVNNHDAWTVLVDAQTGEILHSRRDVNFEDIKGTVSGMATPGTLPDIAGNSPVQTVIPGALVNRVGGGSDFSDIAGMYLIPFAGTGAVTVNSAFASGEFGNVNSFAGAELTATANGNTSAPVNLLFNGSGITQDSTAQTNAFIHTHTTRNYVVSRAPAFTALDMKVTINTAVSGTCNAFYSSAEQSINFFNAGGGCVNTAYSTVVAHEYGHFMVNRRNLAQGAFGEGFSDTVSILQYDDPILGREFFGPGTFVRDPKNSSQQFPCSGGSHFCGEVLGGVWVRIVENFKSTYGPVLGLELARQLHVDWYLITQGGQGENAAHPTTAIEVLTVDDDDGNIANGTPNYALICSAFSAENIDCPELALLNFSFPNGLPAMITPGTPTPIDVVVTPNTLTPQPNTGTLTYRTVGGTFSTIPMAQTSPNVYIATIPAASCGTILEYFFGAKATTGATGTSPNLAPVQLHSAPVANGLILQTFLETTFAGGLPSGWSATGLWHASNSCSPGATCDGTTSFMYYGLDAQCNFENGNTNSGVLKAPTIDLTGASGTVVLDFCYNLETENNSSFDHAQVRVNGVVVLDLEESASWKAVSLDLSAFSGQLVNLEFFFDTVDSILNNFNGFQVDSVKLEATALDCGDCYPDCDGSGGLDFFDFLCFQNEFGAGTAYADCDGNGSLDFFDFLCFQNEFGAGCP